MQRRVVLREPDRRAARILLPPAPFGEAPRGLLQDPLSASRRFRVRAQFARFVADHAQRGLVGDEFGASQGFLARSRASATPRPGRQQSVDAPGRVAVPGAEPRHVESDAQQVTGHRFPRVLRLGRILHPEPRGVGSEQQRPNHDPRSRAHQSAQPDGVEAPRERDQRRWRSRSGRFDRVALPQRVQQPSGRVAARTLLQDEGTERADTQQQLVGGVGPRFTGQSGRVANIGSERERVDESLGEQGHVLEAGPPRDSRSVAQRAHQDRRPRVQRIVQPANIEAGAQRDRDVDGRLFRLADQPAHAHPVPQSDREIRPGPHDRPHHPQPTVHGREQSEIPSPPRVRQSDRPPRPVPEGQLSDRDPVRGARATLVENARPREQPRVQDRERLVRRAGRVVRIGTGRQQARERVARGVRRPARVASVESGQQLHPPRGAERFRGESRAARHQAGREPVDGDPRRVHQPLDPRLVERVRQQAAVVRLQPSAGEHRMAGHTRESDKRAGQLLRGAEHAAYKDAGRELQPDRGDRGGERARQRGDPVPQQQQDTNGGACDLLPEEEPSEGGVVRERDKESGRGRDIPANRTRRRRAAAVLHRRQPDLVQLHDGMVAEDQRDGGAATPAPAGHGPRLGHVRDGARPRHPEAAVALVEVEGLRVPLRGPLFRPVPLLRLRRVRLRDDLPRQLLVLPRPQLVEQRGRLLERRLQPRPREDPDGRDRDIPGRERVGRAGQPRVHREAPPRGVVPEQQRDIGDSQFHVQRGGRVAGPPPRGQRAARAAGLRVRPAREDVGAVPGSQRDRHGGQHHVQEDEEPRGVAVGQQPHRQLSPVGSVAERGRQHEDGGRVGGQRVELRVRERGETARLAGRASRRPREDVLPRRRRDPGPGDEPLRGPVHGGREPRHPGDPSARRQPGPSSRGRVGRGHRHLPLRRPRVRVPPGRAPVGPRPLRPPPRQDERAARRGEGPALRRLHSVQREGRGLRVQVPRGRAGAVGARPVPALARPAAREGAGGRAARGGRGQAHSHHLLARVPRQRVAARGVPRRAEDRPREHKARLEEEAGRRPSGDRGARPRPRVPAAPSDVHRGRVGREEVLGEAAVRHARLRGQEAGRQQEGERPKSETGALHGRPVGRRRVDQA